MGSTTSLVGRSVLILEDEPLIALGLKDAFEAEGANVYLASNPNGALHLAKLAALRYAEPSERTASHFCTILELMT
jgi:CheY-like chemotaxis protein